MGYVNTAAVTQEADDIHATAPDRCIFDAVRNAELLKLLNDSDSRRFHQQYRQFRHHRNIDVL
jgi:hypothetical protein